MIAIMTILMVCGANRAPDPEHRGTGVASASNNVGKDADVATCAGHVQQLGSESLLPNLMEVKG